jgi:nucleoside-diphosphate-sugar epimerase/phosphohistidine swiveling domain-containing protein
VRVAVTGASGVLGRGLVARLLSRGHDVVGLARHSPESWPSAAQFVHGDIRDAAAVRRAVAGAEVIAHCAWAPSRHADDPRSQEVNIGGTANVLAAMANSGTRRIVFTSSAHVYGTRRAITTPAGEHDQLNPVTAEGRHNARAEQMLAASGAEWVAIRSALIVGRDVDNWVQRLLAWPAFPDIDGSAEQRLQLVHTDDALRVLARAVLDADIDIGPLNLAASGEPTFREIAAALGRRVITLDFRAASRLLRRCAATFFGELRQVQDVPLMDTSRLRDQWGFTPAWNAAECVADATLGVRGRVTVGKRVMSLPWRISRVQDIPTADAPAADGTVPVLAGPEGANGEFDTPIDPRFPTFIATNLSEALPGPFSPSSFSVTVRGLRASGAGIAARLRPGGLIQREIAMRTVAVFAHRLYGGITSAHFMAATVPFVKPATIVANSGYFGPSVANLPIFGDQHPLPRTSLVARQVRTLRNIGVFGVNLVGLSAGSADDTADYVADIDRLEQLAGRDVARLDDNRLLSLILLARDHAVDGWVLASGSFMLCAAFNSILRGLCGPDTIPPAGPELVSARPLAAIHRLVAAARRDPQVQRILAYPDDRLDALCKHAPQFHAAVLNELALIGHRGPAEAEMRSTSYADNPELLLGMVAKSLTAPDGPRPAQPSIPVWGRPVAVLAARQLRERETRRDRLVRAIWVLRGLLREYGRRLVDSGVLKTADDVFYLLVDELDALPVDASEVVARRRAEQRRLIDVVPPAVFTGSWQPGPALAAVLEPGQSLHGLGVCGGRVRGRVRMVRPETIDELQPGEILVAEATDVGYTTAFSYAAAVVTELGGPMSHAAVVAREFGFPCVVDAAGATRRLPPGGLVDVDGATGEIQVLELADHTGEIDPAASRPE